MFNFLTVLTFLVSTHVFAQEAAVVRKTKKKVEAPAPASYKWPNMLMAEYSPETEVQKNSSIYYYADLNYHPSYTHHYRWFQRVSHILTAEPGKDNPGQMTLLNPRVNYYYNFKEPEDKSYHLAIRIGTELGTSQAAQADGINAISMVRLEFDKRFAPIIISFRPYVSHWATQYATNSANEPLPMFTVGHYLYVAAQITPKFWWGMDFDTGFQMFQPADVKASQAALNTTSADPLETSRSVLFFATEFGYRFLKSFQMRAGYYQFDKFVSEGKYDIELFNNNTTRYYVGFDYFF